MEQEQSELTEDEILQALNSFREESKANDKILEDGKLVESFLQNRSTESIYDNTYVYWDSNKVLAQQVLRNIILTWSSLLTKDRPSVYGVSLQDTEESVAAAEIVTKYIEYYETEEHTALKWSTVVNNAATHGTGFLKIIYNTETRRVEWVPLNIYDVMVENCEHIEQISWCVIRSLVSKQDAIDLLKAADIKQEPALKEYQDGRGISRKDKVEKFEIWQKPNSKYPKGYYACVVSDRVVEVMDYPHSFKEQDGDTIKSILPIIIFRAIDVRASTLGETWAVGACPLQASINKIFNAQVNNAVNSKQQIIMPRSFRNNGDAEDIDEDDRFIYLNAAQAQQANIIRWLSPAPIDAQLQNTIEANKMAMWDMAGIDPRTSGAGAVQTHISGKALAFQAELDSNKWSKTFQMLESAMAQAWELTLKLIQKYYTSAQQFKITGLNPQYLTNADLAGVTVRLEPRKESDSKKASKIEKLQQDVANGFADPASLSRFSPSLVTESMRAAAKDEIVNVLEGKDVEDTILDDIDPGILIDEIDKEVAGRRLQMDMASVRTLMQFRRWILNMMKASATPEPGVALPANQPDVAPLPDQTPQPR